MASSIDPLLMAFAALQKFNGADGLTLRIGALERKMRGANRESVCLQLEREGIEDCTLSGAMEVKRLAGQVNVAVHALGILLALPNLLEDGEAVEALSLGAGNTGRDFDLVTDRRVAEFKFIAWRGGPEAIRQNSLFVDLYHLAEADTPKRREMYLTDLVCPLKFLEGRRALKSVLTKHGAVAEEFFRQYGSRFQVTCDYWNHIKDRVRLIDVCTLVPTFKAAPAEGDPSVG